MPRRRQTPPRSSPASAAPEPPHLLVVDDAHNLDADAWRLLDAVLTYAPDRVRVVLATRRDVPLRTVALQLCDSLTVLRSDALRFDDDDARRLIAAHAPGATNEEIDTLMLRADGWAAALVLGARALAGATDREAARAALAHTEKPVLDYLLGEVFDTLSAASRHVLLCTAARVRGHRAAAVVLSGDPDAAEHLAALAVDGLLVTRYSDGDPASWQYHPLLRELLRRQVAVDGPDHALAVAAHARAARHYALHGDAASALRHASAAGEHDLAVTLLVDAGVTLMTTGHEDVVGEALRRLPDDAADRHPALLGVRGLLMRSIGNREEAVRVAALAARAADALWARVDAGRVDPPAALDPAQQALLADSALLNAWLARFGWHDPHDALAGCPAGPERGLDPGRAATHAAAELPPRSGPPVVAAARASGRRDLGRRRRAGVGPCGPGAADRPGGRQQPADGGGAGRPGSPPAARGTVPDGRGNGS